jgi:hypothetical protein
MSLLSTFLSSASISLGLPDEFSALDARMALDATWQSNSFTLFRDVIQLRELSVMLAAPVVPERG